MFCRNDEADKLPAGDDGDVDAVHRDPACPCRSAEMPPLIAPVVLDALLDAVSTSPWRHLGDGQAEISGKADRPGALALCGNLVCAA